jgi:indole-3-glycerol phosphate synthase
MTILDEIVAYKRADVARRKLAVPTSVLTGTDTFNRRALSACDAIRQPDLTGIIAEFKRKSPSKGIINDRADVAKTTQAYARAGAACLSVLTDDAFFGGSRQDLQTARLANPKTPLLRKDFIIDPYQVIEAKALGADLILLIASCLSGREVLTLSRLAHDVGMEVLLEVHNQEELDRTLTDTVDMVGVNNRNLATFAISVDTSLELIRHIPDTFVRVAESGLRDAATIMTLRQAGYDAFLIGETFMKTPDPAAAMRTLVIDLATSTIPQF